MSVKKRRRRTSRKVKESALGDKQRAMLTAAREAIATMKNQDFGRFYVFALEQAFFHGNDRYMAFISELEQIPVSIETFIDSEEFMGATDLKLWPEVRKSVVEINRNWWLGSRGAIREALLMGATSTGKSEISKVTTLFAAHILGCMKNPQRYWGLPSATSIVFPIIAAKPHVIKKVIYQPMRSYVETMPWFQKHMRPSKLVESEMYFEDKNIRIIPGGTDTDTILGEAIIGAVVDEANFMNVVHKSKRADVSTGKPGVYDQAQQVYNAVTRRKKGRFLSRGPNVGVVCVSSSTRYKNDFTDRRKKEVQDTNEKGIFIYDKAQYEVWPKDRYSGEKLRVVIANEAASDVRILKEGEKPPSGATALSIPTEYEIDFKNDPSGALRDICGISVRSINPFFRSQYKIDEAVVLGQEAGVESIVIKDNVVLGLDGMPIVRKGMFCTNPSKPRYVHIDLSNTGDRCGISMIRFEGLREMSRATGEVEVLPVAVVELAVTIEPDHATEIDIAEVRTWVARLKKIHGYPIKAVTYDAWNSLESRQQWKKQGMKTGHVSVDRSSTPYKQFRSALYDGRVLLYDQPVLVDEMQRLEYDEAKDKIDHPPKGAKDCIDAVCGAYHILLTRSSSWSMEEELEDMAYGSMRPDLGDRDEADRPV